MSRNQDIVRSISAEGSIKTDFDWVGFSITITGHGDSSPDAKEDARQHVDATNAAIEILKTQDGVVVDPDSMRLSFYVAPNLHHTNSGMKHDGYIATYDISFRTKNLSKASLIMDKLTGVRKAQVNAPNFHHDDPDSVYEQVLEKARSNAEQKFSEECRVLGLQAKNFRVISWQVHDGHRGGQHGKALAMATMSLGGPESAPPVELEAGKAEISVSLTLNYEASNISAFDRKPMVQAGQNGASPSDSGSTKPRPDPGGGSAVTGNPSVPGLE